MPAERKGNLEPVWHRLHRMSVPRSLVALPLLVVVLAACSDDGGTAPDMAELGDRTWFVTSITEDGVARPIVDGTEITLTFEQGRVRADAGCNGMSGASPSTVTSSCSKSWVES